MSVTDNTNFIIQVILDYIHKVIKENIGLTFCERL
jgi:hypothetical protein